MSAATTSVFESLLDSARALGPQILAAREEIDATGRLPGDLVRAIGHAGLFSLYLPRSFGGPELDPVSFIKVAEEVARFDGATGWNVAVSSNISMFTGGWLAA